MPKAKPAPELNVFASSYALFIQNQIYTAISTPLILRGILLLLDQEGVLKQFPPELKAKLRGDLLGCAAFFHVEEAVN